MRGLRSKIDVVCGDGYSLEDIQKYIGDCRAVTNFDLSAQIAIAAEKLALMEKVVRIGEAGNHRED
jgi:hypothetical protein